MDEIKTYFESKFSNLTITRIIDYNDLYYVIEAVEDINEVDYNDPYYMVEKETKEILPYTPAFDIDYFFEALENRTVYSLFKYEEYEN